MKKEIIIPVYYIIENSEKEIIDEEMMREEFETKLSELSKTIDK